MPSKEWFRHCEAALRKPKIKGEENIISREDSYGKYAHSTIASHLETNTQFQKYHNMRAGHGFAAEDANAINDTLHGRHVEKVGLSNELNGPDRIVNGVPIQTKYYSSPQGTINSAFDSSGYRYGGQQIEVPSDQYEDCINLMEKKILDGRVRDENGHTISDPSQAKQLVKKGSITYAQAKNIAKAGNIDSLIFDAKNNVISSSYTGGISFLISFARYKWNGCSTQDAIKGSLVDAFHSGGVAMLIGIASSQIIRTRSAAAMTVLIRHGLKPLYGTAIGKTAIEAIARASLGRAIYGAAAVNYVSKLMRSNFITSSVSTAIMTAPDFYRAAISRNISWAQFGKNLAVNVAGVAGGVGGWAAGAATGAAIGSFFPIIGTGIGGIAGGLLGALCGGTGASKVAKAGLDPFIKDDAKEMYELLEPVTEEICMEYLLSEEEVALFIEHIKSTIDASWLRTMYGSGKTNFSRKMFAKNTLSEFCDSLICRRKKIEPPSEEIYHEEVNNFVDSLIVEMDTVPALA